MRYALACWCLFGLAALAPAAEKPADLAGYQGIYKREVEKLNADAAAVNAGVSSMYATNLAVLAAKFQKAGDLDGWDAVRKEQDRFRQQASIAGELAGKVPPVLARLQESCLKDLDTAAAERAAKLIGLSNKYLAALEALKKRLTQGDDISKAFEVKGEIDSVQASPDVVAASRLLEERARQAKAEEAAPAAPAAAAPPRPGALKTPTLAAPVKDLILPAGLKNNLIVYYPFDNREAVGTDKSGKSNPGRIKNAGWSAEGHRGGAATFDGTGDHIESENFLGLAGDKPWTMCCWVKYGSKVKPYDNIISIGHCFKPNGIVSLARADARQLSVNLWSDANFNFDSATDLATGFNFLVVAYDGKALKFYVNAARRLSRSCSLEIVDDSLYIGGQPGGFGGDYLNGLVDEVMVFDKALADADIKSLYDLLK